MHQPSIGRLKHGVQPVTLFIVVLNKSKSEKKEGTYIGCRITLIL